MGGKGSGRKPSTETLLKRQTQQFTPIAATKEDGFFLPNKSGVHENLIVKDFTINEDLIVGANIECNDLIANNSVECGDLAIVGDVTRKIYLNKGTTQTDPHEIASYGDMNIRFWSVANGSAMLLIDDDGTLTVYGQIKNLTAPTADTDAATKKYVDDNAGGLTDQTYLLRHGRVLQLNSVSLTVGL